jgi:hypothetical protein
MPVFSRACDIYQGYNYKKDAQTTVGFITSMKIGDTALDVNQTCKDPMNPTTDLKVVSVLSQFDWYAGATDAFYFTGQVALSNKQKIVLLAFQNMVKVAVVFQFTVYEFDPAAEEYFKAASVDAALNGLLEKNGADLNLSVSNDPSTEVQSPLNYQFQCGVKPQPSSQKVTLASGKGQNIVRQWGIQVG